MFFTHEETAAKLENAAKGLSAVPEALVAVRAARNKMTGKSEGKGEKPSQHVMAVDNVVIRLAILDALERETRISRQMYADRGITEPS